MMFTKVGQDCTMQSFLQTEDRNASNAHFVYDSKTILSPCRHLYLLSSGHVWPNVTKKNHVTIVTIHVLIERYLHCGKYQGLIGVSQYQDICTKVLYCLNTPKDDLLLKVSGDGDLLQLKTSYNAVYISQKKSIKRD